MTPHCRFCTHRNTAAATACAHCGAPLGSAEPSATPASDRESAAPQFIPSESSHWASLLSAARHRRWVVPALAVLLGVLVLSARAVSGCVPALGDSVVVAALPGQLRSAADCAPQGLDTARCVIEPSAPMLRDGITGGRALIFEVRLVTPAALAETVRRWRGSGSVVADGAVFAAVGPAATVWYAHLGNGIRLDAGPFAGASGARAFLTRSGLLP